MYRYLFILDENRQNRDSAERNYIISATTSSFARTFPDGLSLWQAHRSGTHCQSI